MQIKEHLWNYTLYLEYVSNVGLWIIDKHKQKWSKSDISAIIGLKGRKRQATLDVFQFSKQNQEKMTRLAVMTLYKTGHLFNIF